MKEFTGPGEDGRDDTIGCPTLAKPRSNTLFLQTTGLRFAGVPDDIVSDRDSKFTGLFWRESMKLMKVRQSFKHSDKRREKRTGPLFLSIFD